jgi:hypothetical protein
VRGDEILRVFGELLMQNGQHEPIHRLRINLEKRNPDDRLQQRVQSFERDANAKAPIEKRATPEVANAEGLACSDEISHCRSQSFWLIAVLNSETQHPVEQVIPILAVRGVTSKISQACNFARRPCRDSGSVRVALETLV